MSSTTEILKDYDAIDVSLKREFVPWIRSDHAGETGAVWIYKGAACAFWSKKIREMAKEHGRTEQRHLVVMEYLLPKPDQSKLIAVWKIMGCC